MPQPTLTSLILCLSTLGACAGSVDGIPPAIFNGELDVGHPSVGLLLGGSSDKPGLTGSCTVTLVGERTILTAAHCLEASADPASNVVYAVRLEGVTYEVDQVLIHPQYSAYGQGAAAYEVYAYDVAVLRLTAQPAVSPTPLASQPPQVGQAITIVGYGGRPPVEEPPAADGAKPELPTEPVSVERHRATNVIDRLMPEYFVYELSTPGAGNICSGDSGGPTFAMVGGVEAQIGVHSQSNCRDGGGADRRVDAHLAWILQVAGGDVRTTGDAAGGDPQPTPGEQPNTPADEGAAPPEGKPLPDATPPAPDQEQPGQPAPKDPKPKPDEGGAKPESKPPLPDSGTPAGAKPGAPCAKDGDCASGKCVQGAKAYCA